jgi:hypothetical protein
VRKKKNRLDYRDETADTSSSWHTDLDSREANRMAGILVWGQFLQPLLLVHRRLTIVNGSGKIVKANKKRTYLYRFCSALTHGRQNLRAAFAG